MGLIWFALGMAVGAALVCLVLYAGMTLLDLGYQHRHDNEGWG